MFLNLLKGSKRLKWAVHIARRQRVEYKYSTVVYTDICLVRIDYKIHLNRKKKLKSLNCFAQIANHSVCLKYKLGLSCKTFGIKLFL